MGWAGDRTLPGTLHDVCRGDLWAGAPNNPRPRRATWPPRPRPLKAKHTRSVRGTSHASVTLSRTASDLASARRPSSERTARKVRPPLGGVFWRLAGVVKVGALLLVLSYFYPPVRPDPAHGGRSSRCRSRRRVPVAKLLNRASTSGRTPAGLPSSTCPPRAATGYRPPKRSRPERGRGRKTRHPAQPWVPLGPTVRIE
jgi:hypothetical protein